MLRGSSCIRARSVSARRSRGPRDLRLRKRAPAADHRPRRPGIPSLGADALALALDYPRVPLILAHAAIADRSWIWREAAGQRNLFFDTAWWNPADQLALFALLPPGQILFASDTPYGRTVAAALVVPRAAMAAGLNARADRDGRRRGHVRGRHTAAPAEILTKHKAASERTGPDDPVFVTSSGKTRSRHNLRQDVVGAVVAHANRLVEERGLQPLPLEITPHKLRHTYASIPGRDRQGPDLRDAAARAYGSGLHFAVCSHMMRRSPDERERLKALSKAKFGQ